MFISAPVDIRRYEIVEAFVDLASDFATGEEVRWH
jgi:hypothetical protein